MGLWLRGGGPRARRSQDPDDVTKALFEHHPRHLDDKKVKFSQASRRLALVGTRAGRDLRDTSHRCEDWWSS